MWQNGSNRDVCTVVYPYSATSDRNVKNTHSHGEHGMMGARAVALYCVSRGGASVGVDQVRAPGGGQGLTPPMLSRFCVQNINFECIYYSFA